MSAGSTQSLRIVVGNSVIARGSPALLRDSTTKAIAAACMLAVSPASLALAQSAAGELPPLVVETQKKKKKAASAPKQQTAPKVKQASPKPTPSPAPVAAPPVAAETSTGAPAGPYANPNAPYKVETSASGKLTQPLVDTPRTVTAIPKEVIEDKGTRDLRDLARETPGLSIGSAEGGNSYSAFAIRGFRSNNDLFVDNIRNPGNLIPDVFSIEQIEIYKGPSGGIAGRSTIGGAINLISKQPVLNDTFYEVGTTVGTDNFFRTTLDANQAVSRDFAVRANVMYDQHDVAGRDFADSEKWGGLFSATAKPMDSLKITLDYYRYRNDATPDFGVPIKSTEHVPVTELNRGVSRDAWWGMRYLDFMEEEADIGTATIVGKISDGLTLTNRTRVGESRVNYVATSAEGYDNDVHHPNRDQIANIYANQTELNAKFLTGPFKHNMVAGVEVTREEIDRLAYIVTNDLDRPAGTPSPRGFPPNPYFDNDVITGKGRTYEATIDTVGLYLNDTIHLSDQWIINGGVRFDDFERDQVGGVGTATPGTDTANNNIRNNTAKVQDDLFSWNVGVVYKPIPIASIYAAYGTAESPVGSELDSTGPTYNGLAANLVDVKAQEARSVEVGTKWELFNRRLLATAAIFQTDVDNARTNAGVGTIDPVTGEPPLNDVNAYAGKYRVRGLELSAAGNITKEWSVFGGLQLLDTEVLASSEDRPFDVGRRLANIPLVQFSMLSKYQLTDKFSLGGQATYGGEVFGGHLGANEFNNHTVDWWRFDAFAEYHINKNWEIEVAGLNLTDELYYDALYQSEESFAFVAPGRSGYVTVKYKY